MRKFLIAILVMAAVAAAVVGISSAPPRADADALGRDLTAQWLTDATRHVSPNYVHVVASTLNPADFTVDLAIDDPNGGVPLISTSLTGPNGADGGHVYINDSLWAYPSATAFTIRATFKNAAGAPTAIKTLIFAKP